MLYLYRGCKSDGVQMHDKLRFMSFALIFRPVIGACSILASRVAS